MKKFSMICLNPGCRISFEYHARDPHHIKRGYCKNRDCLIWFLRMESGERKKYYEDLVKMKAPFFEGMKRKEFYFRKKKNTEKPFILEIILEEKQIFRIIDGIKFLHGKVMREDNEFYWVRKDILSPERSYSKKMVTIVVVKKRKKSKASVVEDKIFISGG